MIAKRWVHCEPGGWRTLDKDVHKEVIVQVIAAFNDLDALGLSVDDIRNNLDTYGPELYPPVGTRARRGPPFEAERRAAFKALVSFMDVQMNRLMDHVDWSNTYMIFVGDNGTQGGGPAFNVIEPPNDAAKSKASIYRNGVEVPFVIAGPGPKRLKGSWSRDLVNVTDLYATVLDLAGVRQPFTTRASSYSFARALKGGHSQRRVNVSELFPATKSVGGRNPIGSGEAGPFGSGARVVGDGRYRLLAFNRVVENVFVCRDGTDPAEDCLDQASGLYKHVVDLEFYDTLEDPFEDNRLTVSAMTPFQKQGFRRLCQQLNKISVKAKFYQNGKVCEPNGSNLLPPEPTVVATGAQ